jgi:L,D-transpeptidase YcbB
MKRMNRPAQQPSLFPSCTQTGFICLVLLTGSVSCNNRNSGGPSAPEGAALNTIELLLDSAACETEVKLLAPRNVGNLYAQRNYKPLWSLDGRLAPAADTMIRIVHTAGYYGLFLHNYHGKAIDKFINEPQNPFAASYVDMLLTDSFWAMASHLKNGQFYDAERSNDSLGIALCESIDANSIRQLIESQEPERGSYRLLKSCLKQVLDNPAGEALSLGSERQILLKSLVVNMERWRWETEPWGKQYILINIPSYSLIVVDSDQVILKSKVIVGKPDTPTPVLTSKIDCFTAFPDWNVPRKIAVNEILPAIQSDTSYLRRQHFDVIGSGGKILDPGKIAWHELNEENLSFSLRQRHGKDNTLGVLKFVFDNPYIVYLHDTNAKSLFSREMRALSHGCIRVQKARELAKYLIIENKANIKVEDLDSYIALGESQEISIRKPIPIYIRYFTANCDSTGVHVYPDIYDLDASLMRSVADTTFTARIHANQN